MKRTLTDCLACVQKDLSQIKIVREFLNFNTQSEESFIITFKTIEALNKILEEYNLQDSVDFEVLDVLLESLTCIGSNNSKDEIWNRFGYDLGAISGKILMSMEKTQSFDNLYCKFLKFIQVTSAHTPNVWKSVARQIVNVFINKNFSFDYMKKIINIYICTLRQLEKTVLEYFGRQNLSLLKTLSTLLQSLGDFETQVDFMELVLLHFSDVTLLEDFFTEERGEVKQLFKSLRFEDFEGDCRVFLNALNKKTFGRKVYSVCCNMLYLGNVFMEPSVEKQSIWIDANKDSQSLSIKYSEIRNPEKQQVSCVEFSDLAGIRLENSNGKHCLTIKTSNMAPPDQKAKHSNILCIADVSDNPQNEMQHFVDFLEEVIRKERKKRKVGERLSQTCDEILVIKTNNDYDIKLIKDKGKEIEKRVPRFEIVLASDSGNRFEKPNSGCDIDLFKDTEKNDLNTTARYEIELFRESQMGSNTNEETHLFVQEKGEREKTLLQNKEPSSPVNFISQIKENGLQLFQKHDIFEDSQGSLKSISNFPMNTSLPGSMRQEESQELTPSSFVESLNRNLGLDSQESRRSFEDSVPTIEFIEKSQNSDKKNHKLFKNSEDMFDFLPSEPRKENTVVEENKENTESKFKTPPAKGRKKKEKKIPAATTIVLRDRNILKSKFFDSQSDYFREANSNMLKPTIPRLKRKRCTSSRKKNISGSIAKSEKTEDRRNREKGTKKTFYDGGKSNQDKISVVSRPSLLDPNGYAYQRWMKPTTSKRSNFWLEKLNALEKSKPENGHVFDFSDSDTEDRKKKRNQKSSGRVNKPRRRKERTENKQITLKTVKEVLKSNLKLSLKESENKNSRNSKRIMIKSFRKEVPESKSSSGESLVQNLSAWKYKSVTSLSKAAAPISTVEKIPEEKNITREKSTEKISEKQNTSKNSVGLCNNKEKPSNKAEAPQTRANTGKIAGKGQKPEKTPEKLTKLDKTQKSISKQNETSRTFREKDVSLGRLSDRNVTSERSSGRNITRKIPDQNDFSDASMSLSESSDQNASLKQYSEPNVTPLPSEMDGISENLSGLDESQGESTEHDVISKLSSELYQTSGEISEPVTPVRDFTADNAAVLQENTKKCTGLNICENDFGSESDKEISIEDGDEIAQTKKVHSDNSEREDVSLEEGSDVLEIPKEPKTKKRVRSDEDSTSSKTRLKKKHKRYRFTHRKSIPLALQRRIQKKEAKVKQQTDEIVETIKKATDHLFDHIQKKAGRRMGSYLKEAENAAVRIQELDDTESRAQKLEKIAAYYEVGCSVQKLSNAMNPQVVKIRTALKDLTNSKVDNTVKIKRLNKRLKDLIGSEVEKAIEEESVTKKEKLMKCLTQLKESAL